MKEKMNQMFKDKLFLVMLVLGLLTIVAAAGVVTIQRGSVQEENPYMQDPGTLIAEENQLQSEIQIAGDSNADKENGVNASDQTGDSRNTGMSGNYAAENGYFDGNVKRRTVVMQTYINAVNAGDRNVYFIDGAQFFNIDEGDCCVADGCHPTDLGFKRMADVIGNQIDRVLRRL